MNKKRDLPVLEKLVGIIAIAYPLTGLPQLYKIWIEKEVAGVSLLSWSFFLVVTLVLICYSWLKGEKKLSLMWSSWAVIYVAVIVGLLINA
jgi:uncharacterized protein with PQ loop repeat